MFLQKLRRIFRQKKAPAKPAKKVDEKATLENSPPKIAAYDVDGSQNYMTPKITRFGTFNTQEVSSIYQNKFAVSKFPTFAKQTKWQTSRPYAQNAIRYRFRYRSKNSRFMASRSKSKA